MVQYNNNYPQDNKEEAMTENEQLFWNRVLELSRSQIAPAAYEFFVLEARLLKIEHQTAVITLDNIEMKKLFWEQNLGPVILTAGFEIFNAEITANYVSNDLHLHLAMK